MQSTGEETPIVVAQTGPLSGQRWKLQNTLSIGRDKSSDIVIPDRQVSRNHARFLNSIHGVYVEDLGSKNGTHKNGVRIEYQAPLQDGDIIQVALAQEFVFVSADATMPLDDFTSISPPANKLHLEKRSRQVWIDQLEVNPPLSVAQFALLESLFKAEGKVVSRKNLMIKIWGEEAALDVSNQALDALIRRLRDRLSALDPIHNYVVTVRGHGLRLDNPSL